MKIMVIKSLVASALALFFGLAQASSTNTFKLDKLSQGELVFDLAYKNSNAKYDIESNIASVDNGSRNDRFNDLDLNLKVAATDHFSIALNLPISQKQETDTHTNGEKTTHERFGMGDARLTAQYNFSNDTSYGSVIGGVKLSNAKSDTEASGTGAEDYFLGLGYTLQNVIFGVPAKEELILIYNLTGHKNSDNKGGDYLLIQGKSVFRLENIFRPVFSIDMKYTTFAENDTTEYQPYMETEMAVGINMMPIKNFEIEALLTANLYGSKETKSKNNNSEIIFNQNSLDSGFVIRFANKF